ncbi:hypothetical protein EJ070_13390 [Mesorhizobium sp. M1E.F.Ca.ET.045.02.1.1]|uniref:oxidoreductase n=1 Tax=Mesorhizobium sp. M1E.F.Ca.ET.045.02.1.1 TaxID=2493672 RepID=UPI000F755FBF|nr:hypothetical protein [Mesorhizobium sp. M1E.F.Ca.ET.045.02.1.1]AZO21577.1 hypothetical protein EJ070_13390 [Mesorhizobium sp. M1E.F.Ca.ET.045.02.1.1]
MTSATAASIDRRTFFLGVNTGYVTNGLPDDRYVDFYRHRASSGLHCAIVGNVVVPGGYSSNTTTPTLTSDGIWAAVANAIAEKGSLPGIQLATAWEGYVGMRKFVRADPAQVIAAARVLVRDISASGIDRTLSAFDGAAQMAIEHGFRHIQCHAAHGYLLSLLIDDRINGDAERVLDRLAGLAARLASSQVESSIRISLRTGDADFDATGADRFHNRVAALPFDYIDLSSGFYNIDKRLIYPSRYEVRVDRIADSRAVAERNPRKAFILSGQAGQPRTDKLPTNMHIGLCRDLIANPNFLDNPESGCRNRNKCHYFSRGHGHLRCALWDEG